MSVIFGELDSLVTDVDFEERRQDDIVYHAKDLFDSIREYNIGELEKLQELKDELSSDEVEAIVTDLTKNHNKNILENILRVRIESLEKVHEASMTIFGGTSPNVPSAIQGREEFGSITDQVKALNIRAATMLSRTKSLRDEVNKYYDDLASKIDQYTAD